MNHKPVINIRVDDDDDNDDVDDIDIPITVYSCFIILVYPYIGISVDYYISMLVY